MTATAAGRRPVSPAPQDGPVQAPGPGVPARGPPGGGHGHGREFIVRHAARLWPRHAGPDDTPARPPSRPRRSRAHRA